MALVPSKLVLFSFPTSYLFNIALAIPLVLNYWKGSSWQLGCVFRYVRYADFSLIISIETCKEVNSTSFNLKQEVFIRTDEEKTRRGLVYIEERTWHLLQIKEVELWKLIFTPFQAVQWSLISVIWCGELLQLSSNMCGHVCHTPRGERWRNDITQFMSGDKELGLCRILWQTTQLRINWTGF